MQPVVRPRGCLLKELQEAPLELERDLYEVGMRQGLRGKVLVEWVAEFLEKNGMRVAGEGLPKE